MSEQKPAQAGPRDFEPVEPGEARKFLWEGGKTLASAMLWTRDQEHVIETHFTMYSEADDAVYVWIPKDFDPKQFMNELAELGVQECYFSVSLARANIFFKARFVGFDHGNFKFKSPQKMFKVQRRKDMRYTIPEGYVLKFQFDDPVMPEQFITKKVIDISAGGLAFVANEVESAMLPVGTMLKNVTFTVRQKKIVTDAEVRHMRPLPDGAKEPGNKVGILFTSIKAGDKQTIAAYVFDETRKMYSRYL